MQPWQITALKMETSVLEQLDGFIHDHALFLFIGVIWLLLILLVWVSGWRRKPGKPRPYVPPVIVIQTTVEAPPKDEPFAPFPPYREPSDYEDHDWD